MAHKTCFTDVASLCAANRCVGAFRSETVSGRTSFSLTATEDKPNGRLLYDERGDYDFADAISAGELFDRALATWFK